MRVLGESFKSSAKISNRREAAACEKLLDSKIIALPVLNKHTSYGKNHSLGHFMI